MSRIICCALTISLFASSVQAQGDAMIELYGEGVHRFFAGDYMGADQALSQVVDSGSVDPRAHFFRGLVREMQGGDGQTDYEIGARLEAEGKLAVNVGMALSRIQGYTRSKIEKARRDARMLALQQRMLAQPAAPAPSAETTPPVPSETADAGGSAAAVPDLLSDEGLRAEGATEDSVQPDAPALDDSTNPFSDDEPAPVPSAEIAPTDPTPSDSPFDTPATDSPFDTPPADNSSPFGNDANDDNPFGTEPGNPF